MAPPPPAGTPRPAPRSCSSGLNPSCYRRRPSLATPLLRPRSPPAPISLPVRSALTAPQSPLYPDSAASLRLPAGLASDRRRLGSACSVTSPKIWFPPDSAPMVAARAVATSAKQVTRKNFAEAVRELESHVKACDYVTVAALKTGTPTGWRHALPVDTPETAYLKAKLAAESFQPLHITVMNFLKTLIVKILKEREEVPGAPFICSSQKNIDHPMIDKATCDQLLFRAGQVLYHGEKKLFSRTREVNSFRKGVQRLCRHPVLQSIRSMKKSADVLVFDAPRE